MRWLAVLGLVIISVGLGPPATAADPPALDGDWNVVLQITRADNASPPVGTKRTRLWKFTPQGDGTVMLERQRLTSDSFTTYFLTPEENAQGRFKFRGKTSSLTNCIDPEDESVVVPNGMKTVEVIVLVPTELDGNVVTRFNGNYTGKFTPTPEAEAAGCVAGVSKGRFSSRGRVA
jgi:hypothetical protein